MDSLKMISSVKILSEQDRCSVVEFVVLFDARPITASRWISYFDGIDMQKFTLLHTAAATHFPRPQLELKIVEFMDE